jgi:hypothetical protein
MKVALCFIINYEHILHKEQIWREWIEPNQDIINVYFYYKDLFKIKSQWIAQRTIPPHYIFKTSYYHMIPAYTSLLKFATQHDASNKWFCMLTDACCPIISPARFRQLFLENNATSLFSWKPAWWNPDFYKRANLAKLPKELWLANDPWFVLTREHVQLILFFIYHQPTLTQLISSGGVANESLFAIIFKIGEQLNGEKIKSVVTHLTDWSRRSSPTSPHVFKHGDQTDIEYIERELNTNPYAMFIRKIAPEFPDEIVKYYIYEYSPPNRVL